MMRVAWFPSDVTLGIQAKDFDLGFIKPENLVSHGLRVLSLTERPAQRGDLVVPNLFHLRMMEATVFLRTFNAAENV